jgi:hypothetical protein
MIVDAVASLTAAASGDATISGATPILPDSETLFLGAEQTQKLGGVS